MKIISGILLLITAFLSFKHGWDGFTKVARPGAPDLLADLGISKSFGYVLAVLSLAIGVMILLPSTFFAANVINAITILIIMALALKAGNMKIALIEIPFLLIPLVLIYLGYPLRK